MDDKYLEIKQHYDSTSKATNFIVALMALLLNQASIIFGINFSFSDLLCIILFLMLLIKRKMLMPIVPILFFLLTSILVLFTAVFYVPSKFEFNPKSIDVTVNYIKLLISFIYFIVGNNLARLKYTDKIIKWYAAGALIMGLVAFVFTIFNIRFYTDVLLEEEIRFRGLIGDPNYFSILQISAIAYFIDTNKINKVFRYIAIFFLLISILISGSKTGVITLIMYFFVLIAGDKLLNMNINFKTLISSILVIILIILIIIPLSYKIDIMINHISERIPVFERISLIFTDFNKAVSGSGSGRDVTWSAALKMIELSPLFGVGVGTYTGLSNQMWNVNTVAHNTYLQLSIEWGIPLALTFFFYVFIMIGKISFVKNTRMKQNIILRNIIFIFLIGSFAISLNNARMFWLFLGELEYGKCSVQAKQI